jgi:hypothetical protein
VADTLAVDLKASLTWLFSEALDLSSVNDQATLEYDASLADGTAADQADLIWHDQRTLNAGASEDLDLTALITVIFGGTVSISFAKVKAILIVNTSTTAGHELLVGGAGAGQAFATPFNNNAGAKVGVGPDSPLLLVNKKDGWAVTAGTGDILRIQNSGAAAVTYRIVIVGTSA